MIQSIGALLSRFSGMIRLQVIGALLGVSALNDIFQVAFGIPNLIRAVVAEEAVKNALVPVLKDYQGKATEDDLLSFSEAIFRLAVTVFVAVVILGILLAPVIVWMAAPGFTPAEKSLASSLMRIIFPFIFFIGIASLLMGYLYSKETSAGHGYTALAPIAFNGGCILVASLAFWGRFHDQAVYLISLGIVLGGLLQLLVMIPYFKRISPLRLSVFFKPTLRSLHRGVSEVKRQWTPSVLSGAVGEISVIIDRIIASFLAAGSITGLAYAARVFQVPIGVIGVSTSVSLHSTMARHWASGNLPGFLSTLFWGIRRILFFTVPIFLFFTIYSQPLTSILFEYGKFDARGSLYTSYALTFYSIGIVFFCLIRLLKTTYSSILDNRTYALVNVITVGVNAFCSLSLVLLFKSLGLLPLGGLALGTTISAGFQFILLVLLLRQGARLGKAARIPRSESIYFLKIIISTTIMGAISWLAFSWIRVSIDLDLLISRFVLFGTVGVVAFIAYMASVMILGVMPIPRSIKRIFSR